MPTEMLGPGTEAALELLVDAGNVVFFFGGGWMLEDGGWDPFWKVRGWLWFNGGSFFQKLLVNELVVVFAKPIWKNMTG